MSKVNRGIFLRTSVALVIAVSGCHGNGTTNPVVTPPRAAYVGFTPLPYGLTSDSQTWTYTTLNQDGDITAHHFDNGIPWNEALSDTYPYAPNIMNDWALRKANTPAGRKVYVAVTSTDGARQHLAFYRKDSDNLPQVAPFDSYASTDAFDAADVETAYLNYCKRIIAYFKPDYFAFGIEVNLLRKNSGSTVWGRYKTLHQYIYTQLKALYPSLPIFASVAGTPMLVGYEEPPAEFSAAADPVQAYRSSQLSALADTLAGSDYYAISFYPWGSKFYNQLFPTGFPTTMWNDLFSLSTKPIVVAETGYPAADIALSIATFVGSPTAQATYISQLLDQADQRSVKFVINFVLRDYQALCDAVGCVDSARAWQTNGVFDDSGTARPALQVIKSYLARPHR
jgi:hypothetical protein